MVQTAQQMMVYGIWLNLILCFFNLIPIPPLDGSNVLLAFLREASAAAGRFNGPLIRARVGDELRPEARLGADPAG